MRETESLIDLRSDTMTRPSAAMREAMSKAKVGDDVWGEDPTVIELQTYVAQLYGMESALFVPSGTMANQIALLCHTQRGYEVFGPHKAHVITYEAGAAAALAGIQFTSLGDPQGSFTADELAREIRPEDLHSATAGLVWIENTHNYGGGTVFPLAELERLSHVAQGLRLPIHVDGARLLNAATHLGCPVRSLVAHVDSASICLSKGLGAPIGSLLVGKKAFISRALRWRKRLGGAMRQVGHLAAAGLFALEHNRARLAEDHAHAALLAKGFEALDGVIVEASSVQTNILKFDLSEQAPSTKRVIARCAAQGLLMAAFGSRTIRVVTHLDVGREQCVRAVEILRQVLTES